jgi:tRNA pseudouridine32 synthase/23S rRNA pseudouridine746 synthase
MFEHHLVTKTYQALSPFPLDPSDPQIPSPERQVWNSQLVRGKKRTFEAKHGQPATTFAQCLGPITLKPKTDNLPAMLALEWLLKPQSGLPHQLRFEMKKHGVPILGDGLYGGPSLFKSPHMIALRCTKLEFAPDKTKRAHLIPEQIEAALNLHSQIEGELL